ncbi:MAG: ribosomal protein S18-alanine N-acetyltransferase [Actinomycetota bacterium]|nr:ribosomal protein S18-alanine N-acetyltransferase [Actinomycetota bacterium]
MSETTATELPQGPGRADGEAVVVRRLTYGDLPAVLSIERRSFPAPWSLAMFVLELSKPSGVCLAAAGPHGLSGYLVCSRYADVWHLMNVAVDPDLRRRGLAGALIEGMLDEAGRDGRYTLEVRVSNHVAIEMYERIGFRRAGRRRRYYHDNGEDALIMWLGEPGFIG